MNALQIGKYIKEYRERLHLSQEDLCENICAVSTLSRIERGIQFPSRKLLEYFFNRLGIGISNIPIPMSNIDFERTLLEERINSCFLNKCIGTVPFLLNSYINVSKEIDCFEKQFYCFMKTKYESVARINSLEVTLEHYLDAIHLTFKQYKVGDNISKHLLSKTEILILTDIAITLYYVNKTDDAFNLQEQIADYYETHSISDVEKASCLPAVLFNLSTWEGQRKDFKQSFMYAEKGLKYCYSFGKLSLLPYLLFNKGYALLKLGKEKEGAPVIKLAFGLMYQSGNTDDYSYGIESIKKEFGLDLGEF